MSENVVELTDLSRQFGEMFALDGVSLQVRRGCVHGLVGANGAGKTTMIKHILGLLKAESGSVRVFGLDPVRNPVAVLRRIGYLSEERELPEWMRVDELMRYTQAFHPNWNQAYADELLTNFGLDDTKKVKNLSKGMRAQVGLIVAVAHRPELLLLDEPSTGLDAVVRRDILNAIIRAVADDGRTALFSSHLLDEVEQMSDYISMIDRGRVILQGSVDDIKESHHLLSIRFPTALAVPPQSEGILSAEGREHTWNVVCNGDIGRVHQGLERLGGEILYSRNASLQEIFVARVGRECLAGVEEE